MCMTAACLLALSESMPLARAVAQEAQLALSPLEERSFEGGEFKLRPIDSVRELTTFVWQSLSGSSHSSASERLVRLLFLLQGLRDVGAARRIAVIPYMAFARKDRRTQPHDPVSSRYVAELLEATRVDRVVTLDVHNPAALDNAFRLPVDHLSALPLMVDHFARRLADLPLCVASPDVGGVKRAQLFRELLEVRLARPVEMVFIEKRRALGVVSGGQLVGSVAGAHVIVIDDLCATGGTLIRAARACRSAGATTVHAAFTHAPLLKGIEALIAAEEIADITCTDSAIDPEEWAAKSFNSERLHLLSIAPLMGQALRRIVLGRTLDPLLNRWPVQLED